MSGWLAAGHVFKINWYAELGREVNSSRNLRRPDDVGPHQSTATMDDRKVSDQINMLRWRQVATLRRWCSATESLL